MKRKDIERELDQERKVFSNKLKEENTKREGQGNTIKKKNIERKRYW